MLAQLPGPRKQVVETAEGFPQLAEDDNFQTAVLINGTLNHHFDIQGLLTGLKKKLARSSRLLLVLYNPYFRWIYRIANALHLRNGELPTTFLRRVDLSNVAKVSGFEIVREKPSVYCPFRLFGLGDLINRLLPVIPLIRWFSFAYISVWRPILPTAPAGLSCVIPARNERGNIEQALLRFPKFKFPVEIIFVEGGSTDGTWDEIQRVAETYRGQFAIKTLRQQGTGKADAVRLGFAYATQPVLTILDADLTVPPEMLSRFCEAYYAGLGDFMNGSRLVYGMEHDAMRPLNRVGNVLFAKALSYVLDAPLSDSLCGTKLISRADYRRILLWKQDFGEFDPFGDFELLFAAAVLGLGIVDIPVRYLARTYGATNIRRFRHGMQLLRMTLIGFLRIKLAS